MIDRERRLDGKMGLRENDRMTREREISGEIKRAREIERQKRNSGEKESRYQSDESKRRRREEESKSQQRGIGKEVGRKKKARTRERLSGG